MNLTKSTKIRIRPRGVVVLKSIRKRLPGDEAEEEEERADDELSAAEKRHSDAGATSTIWLRSRIVRDYVDVAAEEEEEAEEEGEEEEEEQEGEKRGRRKRRKASPYV